MREWNLGKKIINCLILFGLSSSIPSSIADTEKIHLRCIWLNKRTFDETWSLPKKVTYITDLTLDNLNQMGHSSFYTERNTETILKIDTIIFDSRFITARTIDDGFGFYTYKFDRKNGDSKAFFEITAIDLGVVRELSGRCQKVEKQKIKF